MSTTATFRADVKVSAPLTQDNPVGTIPADIDCLVQLSNTEIPKRHYKRYTVAASSALSLDLASALEDGFGNALTVTKVKVVIVKNRSTSGSAAASVERPSSNGVPLLSAAGTIALDPLFMYINKAGVTVTASTGDLLSINNDDASASAEFDVLICGA